MLYHGVLAPHCGWRARVAYGAPAAAPAVAPACSRANDEPTIATVEDPGAIRAILAALAESRELTERAPPFAAAQTLSHAATIGA